MNIPNLVKSESGFSQFNEVQEAFLKTSWTTQSVVVAAPTASGKTITAELAALESVINHQKKAIYTCPLRALASEHYREFKKKYASQKVRACLSTGDLDSTSDYLDRYDVIFTTFEKLDSLLRHDATWLSKVGVLIIDEVHELDSSRGPTIEMVITKLRVLNPAIKTLALSATIPNAQEIADWLGAQLVYSEFRPVALREGVYTNNAIRFGNDFVPLAGRYDDPLLEIVHDTLSEKQKQALVFCSTRKNAQTSATKIAKLVSSSLSEKEKGALQKLSQKIENCLEIPTEQCTLLSKLVLNGVSFHHAGLVSEQRTLIEEAFKDNLLKVLCSTPTLCLSKDSKVWDGMGEKSVTSMKKSDSITILNGNKLTQRKIADVQSNFNEKKLLRLSTILGFSTTLTQNHQLLVRNGNKIILKTAQDCRVGDKIPVVGKIVLEKLSNPTFSDFCTENELPVGLQGVNVSSDWFYLIGSMLGDGCSGAEYSGGKIRYKSSPSIVGKDPEIFSTIISILEKEGIHYRKTRNSYGIPQLVISKKKWFREFLVNTGVDLGVKKYVPEILLNAPDNCIQLLLQGLFDTDGYAQKNKGIGFSNASIDLIWSVKKLLLRFGIISRIRNRKGGRVTYIHNHAVKSGDHYELLVENKRSILQFAEKIRFSLERKNSVLNHYCQKLLENIHYIQCRSCNYLLHADLFGGRTKKQQIWGFQKKKIILLLGNKGSQSSKEIGIKLGFIPYKGEKRLDHHLELINRVRKGNEVYWSLNPIGQSVYHSLTQSSFNDLLFSKKCPICEGEIELKIKGGWKDQNFDGDIYWDSIKKIVIQKSKPDEPVYDVILPAKGNDHHFVADGIIVHNSAGVNLPAFRAIITSMYRFSGNGSEKIPVREYKQMAGRSGRPKYDTHGESIILSKSESEADFFEQYYIHGQLEGVTSQLGIIPILRTHLLACIANRYVFDQLSLEQFFSKTLYGHQYGNQERFFQNLQAILKELHEMGFIELRDALFAATPLGQRVSELYIDPHTAHAFIIHLNQNPQSNFSHLLAASRSYEMAPYLTVKKEQQLLLWEEMTSREEVGSLIQSDLFENPDLLAQFALAKMLEGWLNERTENQLLEDFNIQPGTFRQKTERADWLLYSLSELAKLREKPLIFRELSRLRDRLKYGIKEELLPLVQLRGIGRVRARKLYSAGLARLADVKKAPLEKLSSLLGDTLAASVLKQLGAGENANASTSGESSTLGDFDAAPDQ